MVNSRKDLLQKSKAWMSMAKEDLRRQVISFMESVGTNENALANALCITVDELNSIIHGNGDIALSTFAKLLIATDNVIEIKPISETPLANNRNPFIDSAAMPPIPFSGLGMPKRNLKRDSKGRFVGNNASSNSMPNIPPMGIPNFSDPSMSSAKFGAPTPTRFGGMPGMAKRLRNITPSPRPSAPRRELVTTILANGWDSEIDIMNSTSDELVGFLMDKGLTPAHFAQMAETHAVEEPENDEVNKSLSYDETKNDEVNIPTSHDETENETARIMRMIQEKLERNPQLLENVKKYIH